MRLFVSVLLLVALRESAVYGQSQATAAATALPSTTKLFFSTSDFPALRKKWRATQYGRMSNAPAMKAFMDDLERDRQKSWVAGRPRWGFTADDLESVATGEVAMARIPAGEDRAAFVAYVVAADDAKVGATFGRIIKAFTDIGAAKSTVEIGPAKATLFDAPRPGSTRGERVNRYYVRHQGVFLSSGSMEVLADIITRLDQQGRDSLDQLTAYRSVMQIASQVGDSQPADVRWYYDPFGFEPLVRHEQSDDALRFWESARQQGFEVIQAAGGFVTVGAPGYDMLHYTGIYAPGPLSKSARMLDFVPISGRTIPPWIPADVGQFTSLGLDLLPVFDAYGSYFDEVYGEGDEGLFQQIITEMRDDPGSPGVDVRKDIVGRLKSPVRIIRDSDDGQPLPRDQRLYLLETNNERAVRASVDKLFQGDKEMTKREVGSHVVWVFPPKRSKKKSSSTMGPDLSNMAVCVAHNHLMIATSVRLLERVLAPAASPLAKAVWYQQADRLMGSLSKGEISGWQLSAGARSAQVTYDLLRAGKIDQSTTLIGRALALGLAPRDNRGKPADEGVDYRKLPEFRAVQVFFPVTGALVKTVKDGWAVAGFALAKPQPVAK